MDFELNFTNFFGAQDIGAGIIGDNDSWQGLASYPQIHTLAQQTQLEDIDSLYTELHRQVDQVVIQICSGTSQRLGHIQEQNRRVIEKLTALESAIGGIDQPNEREDHTMAVPSSNSAMLEPGGFAQGTQNDSTKRVILNKRSELLKAQDIERSGRSQSSQPDTPHIVHKLDKLLIQVGNEESRIQVAEFAAQMTNSSTAKQLPDIAQISDASAANAGHFLQLIMDLGAAIEVNSFDELSSRMRKRIALAHFYHAYTLAQEHPLDFLSWCDEHGVQRSSKLPKRGRTATIVQDRFSDLVFGSKEPKTTEVSTNRIALRQMNDESVETRRRITKIQSWRKLGKRFACLVGRFGYGILLLLPHDLVDEDLRTANDDALANSLNLVESRKHAFADVLQQATDLLTEYIFPACGSQILYDNHGRRRMKSADLERDKGNRESYQWGY